MSEEKRYPASLFDFTKRPLSYSSLKHILKSPAHFAEYFTGEKKPPSDALKFGGVTDVLLFNPEDLPKRYAVSQKFDKRTTVGKQGAEEFEKANVGKIIVSEEDVTLAKVIVERIKAHPLSKPLIDSMTSNQLKLDWRDKQTQLPMIGYIDGVSMIADDHIVWDLKTAADASDKKFERDASEYNYPLQAYMYAMAYIRKTGKFPEFRFIVCEKEPPFAINVFKPDSKFMEYGKACYRKALDRVAYCMKNDCFDLDYDFMCQNGYHGLSVPPWIAKQLD